MGQKVNPIGARVGTFLPWKSRWFTESAKYKDYLIEDIEMRNALMDKLNLAGITKVGIDRLPKSIVVTVTVARPGVVIGRGGRGIEDLKKLILDIIRKGGKDAGDMKIEVKVLELKNPELSAQIVATRLAAELVRRLPHRMVIARTMDRVMQSGALGIKIVLAGRIAGTEIARTEKYLKGSVPAQTLRANIDYAQVPALLKRGYVGVKIYIHKKPEEE